MIISHRHRFIFIRPLKVAGKSFEVMLSKHLGPKDVVLGGAKYDEKLDEEDYGVLEERNAEGFKSCHSAQTHAYPDEVRKFVGEKVWREYRKITILRNPWDAMVSLYFWNLHRHEGGPFVFKDFVKWNLTGSYPLNRRYMLMSGKLWATYYLKFERLQADTNKLMMGELGIKGVRDDFRIPRTHNKTRPSGLHYSCMYDDDTKNMIQIAFREQINLLGMSFKRYKGKK